MRRPPPLPTPPEQETKPAPARPPRRPRDVGAELVEAEPIIAPVEPETLEGLTARDVWRAARARRKTLRAEIRRFTQRSRRRRIIWLSALGAVVLLIGGSIASAYSPLFAVEKITIVGASTLDLAAVEAALSDQIGTPLALVSDSEIKAALIAFPLIETYALEAKPPHGLTVRIVERTPIGVIESDAGYTLVDAAGVALSTTPTRPEGQPVLRVSGGIKSDAFESVGLVVRSLPVEVRSLVSEVSATTLDDVTLKLSTGLTVVWGSAEDSVMKSQTLSKVLIARPDASSVDVSSYLVPVVG
ncbi:cell division protein [Microbacterium sp. CH12i]|uniref:FtsQ-type POTRA domain-containing protein n=1 Tax=Microbacterium sp. CH12i TaxID=1479651 RepID=UPI0004616BCB|nr:FtsQ-type POTRA domain-containing protein [Microbacterium sp. CH12i]KDA06326.1 cell division protein [Microbacterium sp. CH12i]